MFVQRTLGMMAIAASPDYGITRSRPLKNIGGQELHGQVVLPRNSGRFSSRAMHNVPRRVGCSCVQSAIERFLPTYATSGSISSFCTMRLWSLHPSLLDRMGLVALWREALLAQAVLLGQTKGYRNHPQLDRFRECSSPD